MTFAMIEEAMADFEHGRFVIIVDDKERENEGDLAIAANFATAEAINFMARHGRGLICVALEGHLLDRLGIPLMVPSAQNSSGFGTAFTVSVEARQGVTTGISAYDRARTVQTLIDPASTPADIAMPGHIFPLRAQPGGVLARRGQTEASVDLARLAGLTPAAVICEIMARDGTMARFPQLRAFARRHNLKIISVADLAAYRQRREPALFLPKNGTSALTALPLVNRVARARLPTDMATFETVVYQDREGREHMLVRLGDLSGAPPLVRLHSECLTGDVLGSRRCDCGEQLQLALQRIASAGRGVLLYLRQEGRGIGLANKIRAYALQEEGVDTVEANTCLGFPADARSYGVAAAMLQDVGITAVRLMTNNPHKVQGLQAHGINVAEQTAHQTPVRAENRDYLRTKMEKMSHQLAEEYLIS